MQIEAIWLIFKYVIVPFLLAGALYFSGYQHGEKVIQTKLDAFQQAIKETSDTVVINGLQREKELSAQAETLNRKIEEQANVHNTQITAITESNRLLLAQRMQRDTTAEANRCRTTLSVNTKTTSSRIEPIDTGRIILSEDEGLAIVNAAKEADELVESLRACRSYIESLQK